MRVFNFMLALMFLVFAFLQVNDANPAIWILIYGSMSVVCVMAIFESYNRRLLIALVMLFSVYCIFLGPDILKWLQQEDISILFDNLIKMKQPYFEESREFLGLTMSMVVVVFYIFRSYQQKPA